MGAILQDVTCLGCRGSLQACEVCRSPFCPSCAPGGSAGLCPDCPNHSVRARETRISVLHCPYCGLPHDLSANAMEEPLSDEILWRARCPRTHRDILVGPVLEVLASEWCSGESEVYDESFDWEAESANYYSPDEDDWKNLDWWDECYPGTRGDALILLDILTHTDAPATMSPIPRAEIVRLLVAHTPELASAFRRIRKFVAGAPCDLCGRTSCPGICESPPDSVGPPEV